MSDETPDPVAAALAPIRERYCRRRLAHMQEDLYASSEDVPRLLAALEAVLELHQPGRFVVLGRLCRHHEAHRHFSITSTEAASVTACADCAATVYKSCTGCGPQVPLDRCPTRQVIRGKLLGEEGAASNGDVCGIRAPTGPAYFCTKPLGHPDDHFDEHASGVARYTWPQGEAVSRALLRGGPRLMWYVLVCRECGNGDLPMPFESPEARGKWAAAHAKATGHDKWLVVDQEDRAGSAAVLADVTPEDGDG